MDGVAGEGQNLELTVQRGKQICQGADKNQSPIKTFGKHIEY